MNAECLPRLTALGISYPDAIALRRIAMTLHAWHELECGTDRGAIERDETTGKTYWLNSYSGRRYATPDRETGALKRLAKIMANYVEPTIGTREICRGCELEIEYVGGEKQWHDRGGNFCCPDSHRHEPATHIPPKLSAYIQGDPRGAALYILRPGDVPAGEDPDAYYSRGIAVYK